jgi:hypothetical protein
MAHLVQIINDPLRRVALVDEPHLRLLADADSVYALANAALASGLTLSAIVSSRVTSETIDYDTVYEGRSAWRLLPSIDHPLELSRCLVSGTGLTHLGSAADRNAMHGKTDAELTDSMRMFKAGLEGGRPAAGAIGTAPEWFYKGPGSILRAHGEPLEVPSFSDEGGEEAEVAGIYVIDANGQPWRVGMAIGNEFSDHRFEKTNYLNLAGSKIRTCSIGPELVLDPTFDRVPGRVEILRNGRPLWAKEVATGEHEMCHTLANIEHHHFKFDGHRRPGDVHVHFFGAVSLSFGEGVELSDGDEMVIRFEGFGRPLRNRLRVAAPVKTPVGVRPLG